MVELIIRTQGLDVVAESFERLASGSWRRGLMAVVGPLVQAQSERRVASEKTDPSGARWAPWAPSTAARRSGGNSLLVYVGKLLSSFFNRPSDTLAEVGNTAPYGGFLNDGTSLMPQREFLGLSAKNATELERAVDSFIQSRLSI